MDYAEAEEGTDLGLRIFEVNGRRSGGFDDYAEVEPEKSRVLLEKMERVMRERSPSCMETLKAKETALHLDQMDALNQEARASNPEAAERVDKWAAWVYQNNRTVRALGAPSLQDFLNQTRSRYYIVPGFGVITVQNPVEDEEIDRAGEMFNASLKLVMDASAAESIDPTLEVLRPKTDKIFLYDARDESARELRVGATHEVNFLNPQSHLRGDHQELEPCYDSKRFYKLLVPEENQIPTIYCNHAAYAGKDLIEFLSELRKNPRWRRVFIDYPWLVVKHAEGYQGRQMAAVQQLISPQLINLGIMVDRLLPCVVQPFFPSKRVESRRSTLHRYSGRYAQWLYFDSPDTKNPEVLGEFCYRSLAPEPFSDDLTIKNFICNHKDATLQKEDSKKVIDELREIGKEVARRAIDLQKIAASAQPAPRE